MRVMPGTISNPSYVNPAAGGGSESTAVLVVANQAARLALLSANAKGRIIKQQSDTSVWALKPNGVPATSGDWELLGYYSVATMAFQSAGAVVITGGTISGVAFGAVTWSDPAAARNSLGLGNVNNTSDANKPVSTAQATAIAAAKVRSNHSGTQAIATVEGLPEELAAKAPVNSPAFTGTPTAPTATSATNNTQVATTAFVWSVVQSLSGGVSWGEISGTISSQPDLATALAGLQSGINAKAPLDLTGPYPPLNAGCAYSTLNVAGSISTEGTVSVNGVPIYFQKGGMAPYPEFRIDIDGFPYSGVMTKQQVIAFVVACINSSPEQFGCVALDNGNGTALAAAIEPGSSGTSILTSATLAGASWTGASLAGITFFGSGGGTAGTSGKAGQAYTSTNIPNTWICISENPIYWRRITSLTISDIRNLASSLALKAPISNPALLGIPTAPTAPVGTNSTQVATTAFVRLHGGVSGIMPVNAAVGAKEEVLWSIGTFAEITEPGDLEVTIYGTLLPDGGMPVIVSVPVLAADIGSVLAAKIRAAVAADPAVSSVLDVTGTGPNFGLKAKANGRWLAGPSWSISAGTAAMINVTTGIPLPDGQVSVGVDDAEMTPPYPPVRIVSGYLYGHNPFLNKWQRVALSDYPNPS